MRNPVKQAISMVGVYVGTVLGIIRFEFLKRRLTMKQGIIFDMDGTLWDSADGVAKSWTQVIQNEYKKDMTVTEQDIKRVMGKTMDVIGDIFFPELSAEERKSLVGKCGDWENEYLRRNGGKLYPDLEDTLKKLKENYHLYIVSNCQSGYIEAFLDYYSFERYFEDIECYGNNEKGKGENIRLVMERNELDRAIYVGDIQGDYDATMQAGATFVHAKYGFGTINTEVAEIEKFSELPEVAAEVFAAM